MDQPINALGRPDLRALPQVQKLLETAAAAGLLVRYPRSVVVKALRAALAGERAALRTGLYSVFDMDRFFTDVRRMLAAGELSALRRVINATGIILHTNLGRAPLADAALDAVRAAAGAYSNLEYDLETSARGSRMRVAEPILCELTGAEAALVVNNNAAAMLLALSALASGGEVPVSRGELVEIGGSFRIPDIIRQGGARLVEVGTTNRTRLADYAAAIGADTRLLLKVHPSNYRVTGFTEEVARAELVGLGRSHDLPVLEDLGSGNLLEPPPGLPAEPTVRAAVTAGVDLICFSGDKLLGGPQAGIAVGRRNLIDRMRRHPLMRALRPDKMALAALEATLRLYRDPVRARKEVPVLRMLAEPVEEVAARAGRLCGALIGLPGLEAETIATDAMAGGGSLPEERLPSRAVAVRAATAGPEELARRLRARPIPVIGRIAAGRLLFDLRTVAEPEVEEIAAAMRELLTEGGA
ncbi:L-seryl-tRNA(Sec) selenium transferase [Indioceanicola profundi]|uniref:L-seryl-tRNA(Sec) selenium transferase n=1 Tax=Indioceanicola profundi TaxID=2220096 RepID=UPI000E6A9757|nr:L-seryl-tRNA(Sec) selenium transferase [Indioceanicola profundi]